VHPSRRPTPCRTAGPIAAGLAATLLAVAAPTARAQDLTFSYRVQSAAAARADAAGQQAPAANMLATVRMSGGNGRIDMREGVMPMTGPGGYILLRGAEQRLVLVNPQERRAILLSADALGAGTGALTNNALVKVSMRAPTFAFEELGPGERLLSQPTRRVRIRTGGTTEVRVLGRTSRSTESTVTEAWIAPRPAGVDAAALRAWGRSFGSGLRRTNPELAAQMADYEARYGDGLTLRSVAVTQSTDDKGQVRIDTVRVEVTDLARGRVDPALFQVPAGYETADVAQMAASVDSSRRASGDTGSLGDALKKAADESIRDNATAGVKNAIGGMFRRRRP
jgi:hypothetical protein